ncbi:MAG: FAD-binding oxidoreductase [Rhizobiaceae bacterium]|nr:FAD-binding oxidoreductase [Rhizobiaceae bacterium]
MKTDILIVGGGITGCALAYFLAKAGARTILVEQHELNTQASGSNAGSIHAQLDHNIFMEGREKEVSSITPIVTLLMEAISFWKAVEKELEEDFELETIGGLLVTDRPEQMRTIEKKVAHERRLGLEIDLLSESDVRRVAPYVSEKMIGGALCPIEGEANALVVAPAFARAATGLGAVLMTRTRLLALSKSGSGFVAETSRGRIEADRVVNCAGADGGAVGRMIGVDLPIFGEPIQVSVTEPAAPLIRHLVYYAAGRLTLKQSKRGALIIGGGWPARSDAEGRLALRSESLRDNLAICRRVVPKTGSVRVIRSWPAIVNDTADTLPIIGEIAAMPGYFVASFPRMGFTGGPITARAMADTLLGQPLNVDLAPFSPARFN